MIAYDAGNDNTGRGIIRNGLKHDISEYGIWDCDIREIGRLVNDQD